MFWKAALSVAKLVGCGAYKAVIAARSSILVEEVAREEEMPRSERPSLWVLVSGR